MVVVLLGELPAVAPKSALAESRLGGVGRADVGVLVAGFGGSDGRPLPEGRFDAALGLAGDRVFASSVVSSMGRISEISSNAAKRG